MYLVGRALSKLVGSQFSGLARGLQLPAKRCGRPCVTPGRVFRPARTLSAGQPAIRSAHSGWLEKLSQGVLRAAAASAGLAPTLMWFAWSNRER